MSATWWFEINRQKKKLVQVSLHLGPSGPIEVLDGNKNALAATSIFEKTPRAPSIQIIPTLGLKVYIYDLLWVIWSPRKQAATLKFREISGDRALWEASFGGHANTVRLLLEAAADVDLAPGQA